MSAPTDALGERVAAPDNHGVHIGRVVQVLETVCAHRYGVTVERLREVTGLSRRSIMRYLAALAASGFVETPGPTGGVAGRYTAGPTLLELARSAHPSRSSSSPPPDRSET